MALLDSDLLAIYRQTNLTNYSTTVGEIVARVPAPEAPSLTAVLTVNNTSQNESIIIEDSNKNPVITLSSNSGVDSQFVNQIDLQGGATVGSAAQILLRSTGAIIGQDINLLANPTTNIALQIFEAGTTVAEIDAGTATTTTSISNDGTATFAGEVKASFIDGGVYATD